jgi:hypothetical protein
MYSSNTGYQDYVLLLSLIAILINPRKASGMRKVQVWF